MPTVALPIKVNLRNIVGMAEDDGIDTPTFDKLYNAFYAGEQVEVVAEATDGYWDVRLPDGFIVDALSWYHLEGFEYTTTSV